MLCLSLFFIFCGALFNTSGCFFPQFLSQDDDSTSCFEQKLLAMSNCARTSNSTMCKIQRPDSDLYRVVGAVVCLMTGTWASIVALVAAILRVCVRNRSCLWLTQIIACWSSAILVLIGILIIFYEDGTHCKSIQKKPHVNNMIFLEFFYFFGTMFMFMSSCFSLGDGNTSTDGASDDKEDIKKEEKKEEKEDRKTDYFDYLSQMG